MRKKDLYSPSMRSFKSSSPRIISNPLSNYKQETKSKSENTENKSEKKIVNKELKTFPVKISPFKDNESTEDIFRLDSSDNADKLEQVPNEFEKIDIQENMTESNTVTEGLENIIEKEIKRMLTENTKDPETVTIVPGKSSITSLVFRNGCYGIETRSLI